jgi:superfamily II DNA helicase RecQ
LKDEQRTILECHIDKKDYMAVLLTGFGKSLPFQIYSLVNRTTNDKTIVIVCSPLVALMQDQVEAMSKIPDMKTAYAGNYLTLILPIHDLKKRESKYCFTRR